MIRILIVSVAVGAVVFAAGTLLYFFFTGIPGAVLNGAG